MEKKEETTKTEQKDFESMMSMLGSNPYNYKDVYASTSKSLFDTDSIWVTLLLISMFSGNQKIYSDKDIADIDKRLSKLEGQIDVFKKGK